MLFFLFILFQFNKDPDCANITRNSTCGSGLYCNPWNFTCVPKWFSCDVNSWGTGDGCDCDCGAGVSVDPDCKANRFYYGGRDGAQPTVKGCNGIPGATCDSAVFTCKCFFKPPFFCLTFKNSVHMEMWDIFLQQWEFLWMWMWSSWSRLFEFFFADCWLQFRSNMQSRNLSLK